MLKRSAVLLTIFLFAPAAHAVTFVVQAPSSAVAGDTPDVCVSMPDNDGKVSGVQMDIAWDTQCLSPDSQGNNEGACNVNPETNRTTFRTRIAGSTMKVIMLNIADTTPIAANVQQLFCCQFRVASNAGGRTCGINLNNVIASDQTGQRLQVGSRPGAISVSGSGGSQGRNLGGSGGGIPNVVVPPVISGGNVQQPAAAGGTGTGSGSGTGPAAGSGSGAAPVAPKGIVPSAPNAAAPQGVPGGADMPGAVPGIEQVVPATPAALGTVAAVLGTPSPARSAARTAVAGTPTAKITAHETPKAIGTPTAARTAKHGTPTAKD